MNNTDEKDRLAALEAKIASVKESHTPKPSTPDPHSQAQLAWRMVVELVAGLGIGFGIGYGLDVVLGTTPWLMIVFIFLGLAAGIQTMMRSANEVQREREAAQAAEDDVRSGD